MMLYLIPLFFWISENSFFGWNPAPKSAAEMICDGLTITLFFLVRIDQGIRKSRVTTTLNITTSGQSPGARS